MSATPLTRIYSGREIDLSQSYNEARHKCFFSNNPFFVNRIGLVGFNKDIIRFFSKSSAR